MISEIHEQRDVLEKLANKHLDFAKGEFVFREFLHKRRDLRRVKRFLFLGSGSSSFASILANYYFEEHTGLNSEFEFADEFVARNAVVERGTCAVLISQSGKTKDLLIAAKMLRKKGAFIIVVTNTLGSALDRLSDVTIHTDAGEERGIAATKSFSSQVFILYLLAVYFSEFFGSGIKNKAQFVKDIAGFGKHIDKAIAKEAELKKLAKKYKQVQNIIFIGRRYLYPIALEGAHKTKETAYKHAEGTSSEELRHGAEAMLDKDYLVVSLIPGDDMYKSNLQVLKEVKRTKARILAFSNKKTKELNTLTNDLVNLAKIGDELALFPYLICLQIFAYYLALENGLDIDKARNITKYVAK